METSATGNGFFSPYLLGDITLIVQILFYLALSAGVVAQLQRKYKLHDWLQTPVVVLNIVFIALWMAPGVGIIIGEIPAGIAPLPLTVSLGHTVLGTVAQVLSIYCMLAGWKILPRKIGSLRYWMWAAYTAWTAAIVFGISTYILLYTLPAEAVSPGTPPAQEHNADMLLPDATPTPVPQPSPTNTRVVVATPTSEPTATPTALPPTEAPTIEPTATPAPSVAPTATAAEIEPQPTDYATPGPDGG